MRTKREDLRKVDMLCMPRSGGLKPLQITHEYTHKLIQKEEIRGLGRKLTHICCAHIHIGAQRTHVYIYEHIHTQLLAKVPRHKNLKRCRQLSGGRRIRYVN